MGLIRLERQVHYGNTGVAFDERNPVDDSYLFANTDLKDIWGTARTVTERYGYAFYFDANGDVVLNPYNAPHAVYDLPDGTGGGVEAVTPTAYAGTYLVYSSTVSAFTINLTGTRKTARVDLVVGLGPDFGTWDFEVRDASSTVVASGTVATASSQENFLYDPRQTIEGTNPCIVTLYSGYYGEYSVTLSSADTKEKRLDGFMLWHTDPLAPLPPLTLTSEGNALKVTVASSMADMRNFVTIVGKRKAAVTDSEKIVQNPNNPDAEFVVSAGTDVASIAQPTTGGDPTPNYIGFPKESILFDPSIADDDYAAYVSQAFLYRYRLPKPTVPVEHTLLPMLEPGDPIYAIEETFESVDQSQVIWVENYAHEFSNGRAITTLETVSYPPYPSFQPRADIDLSHFAEQPVVNIGITYEGIDGTTIRNAGQTDATKPYVPPEGGVQIQKTASYSGGVFSLPVGSPWPPIPGTVQIAHSTGSTDVAHPMTSMFPDPRDFTYDQNGDPVGSEFLGLPVTTTGILGPVYLPGFEPNSPIIVKVRQYAYNAYAQTETEVGLYTLGTNPNSTTEPFYYLLTGTGYLTLYRIAAAYPEETLGFGYTWRIEVSWYQEAQHSSADWMTNTPYMHLFNVDYSTPQLTKVWKMGDGSTEYQFNASLTPWSVRYRALSSDGNDPYSGSSPFYDPYTSEIGNLVTVEFDALVSGRYRVSVRDVANDQVVAWLTEPTADSTEPEQHWQMMNAGHRTLVWDGVDQVGDWNRAQSQDYADAAHGAFGQDERPLVGSGFYVWNNEQRVGQPYAERALISMQQEPDDRPTFGHGTFGSWYIRFEAQNDTLDEIAADNPHDALKQSPRVVDTKTGSPYSMVASNNDGDTAAMIYTHLPPPNRVALSVADWTGTIPYSDNSDVGEPDIGDAGTGWQAGPTTDAVINNRKPVRFRFTVQARPGSQWTSQTDALTVKLTRRVHLRVSILDQFIINTGSLFPGLIAPERRVVSRRFTNDDHTIDFVDENYRRADSFRHTGDDTGTEWRFLPSDFKKDFGRGRANEALEFNDYLQLEEVPSWSSDRAIGQARSRLQMALMNYLFYFSVYSQDRSGRYSWAVNTDFVDHSKIIQNANGDWPDDPTDWGDDPIRQFRGTYVVRQWSDETPWKNETISRWSIPSNRQGLLQGTLLSMLSIGAGGDPWTTAHKGRGELPSSFVSQSIDSIGTWTWETGDGAWTPAIARDFHGYYLLPPMVDQRYFYKTGTRERVRPASGLFTGLYSYDSDYASFVRWRGEYLYASVDPRPYDFDTRVGDDFAALPTWQSVVQGQDSGIPQRFFPSSRVQVDGEGKLRLQDGPGVLLWTSSSTEYDLTDDTHIMDYQRIDQQIHYEELRGMFSRGQRPGEAPKKIVSVGPYYINPYRYQTIATHWAITSEDVSSTPYPMYRADVDGQDGWFTMLFRSEYLWESAYFFPTDEYGWFMAKSYNANVSHLPSPTDLQKTFYDGGAWTGWKDDRIVALGDSSLGTNRANVFDRQWAVPPVACAPTISGITTAMRFHLCLTNERRSVPIG